MPIVKFTSPSEFIDELKKEFPDLKAGPIPVFTVLRLTTLTTQTQTPVRSLTIVATIRSHSEPDTIIRLERFCGMVWNMEEADKPVFAKADEIYMQIRQACGELGIELRAGMLEPA